MSRGTVGTPAYMAPEQARDPRQASVASDVYSLGATLLFAATGHPPFRGASVMDVLARLATEEPDLSGLPAELTGLITACMARVPRARPTSSAILAQLGQFIEAQAGPAEEHAYLPEPAMALIGEYQRSPQLTALTQAEEPADDATAASYTELPAAAAYKPIPRRREEHGRPRPAGPRWRHWLRTHLAWAGWACAGAVLIVVGVLIGAALSSSSAPPATGSRSGSDTLPQNAPPPAIPPVIPDTECGTAKPSHGPALCMNLFFRRFRRHLLRPGERLRPAGVGHRLARLAEPATAEPEFPPHVADQAGRQPERDVPVHGQPAQPRFAPARAVRRRGHRAWRPEAQHRVRRAA